MNLNNKKIALVGGVGLAGSQIVDNPVQEPVSEIIIYDNFVRATQSNLSEALKSK
jgi:UDP-glucose 4-epimerase